MYSTERQPVLADTPGFSLLTIWYARPGWKTFDLQYSMDHDLSVRHKESVLFLVYHSAWHLLLQYDCPAFDLTFGSKKIYSEFKK